MSKGVFVYGGIVLVVILLIMTSNEQPLNWRKSFSFEDKNPYGAYTIGATINDLFSHSEVDKSYITIYEILHNDSATNILTISEFLGIDEESLHAVIQSVSQGHTAYFAFEDASYQMLDTLGIKLASYNDTFDYNQAILKDTVEVTLADSSVYSYFSGELQMFLDSIPDNAQILATNDLNKPVIVKIPIGHGQIIVCTTPILFTNYFFMYENNYKLSETLLTQLPDEKLSWTAYYQVGRLESGSSLRVLLSYPSLRYALQFSVVMVLIYMIFGSRRVQRAIPIIKKPPNQTLEFIRTVGLLYFHTQKHHAVALNRISYYIEHLNLRYNLTPSHDAKTISIKTGAELSTVEELGQWTRMLADQASISPQQLFRLNKLLENFYSQTRH